MVNHKKVSQKICIYWIKHTIKTMPDGLSFYEEKKHINRTKNQI